MISKESIEQFQGNMQRIFALKIGRTTYREIQNAVLAAANGDRDNANALFEALLRGESKSDKVEKDAHKTLQNIIDHFCIPSRLARDIYERGDFIQVITSDLVKQAENPLFVNRIRRVDGDELQFVSDVESTMHILNHFVGRLHELHASEGKEREVLKDYKKQIDSLTEGLQQLKK